MSIHRVGIGHHILHTALIRRGLKLATITTSSRCAYPTGGLRRSTLLNGDKLLKEANSDITENWSLLNKKPILSTVLLSARHKVRDWNSILRNDQTKVVAISHLPAIIDKNQHFCILMSDGQLVRILPLHKFFSIKTTLGEMLEDESLLKVTFDAQYMAQQLWRHDNVAVRNIVDIREIGWPGRKNGLGLDMVYTEAFKELHGRRVIESTRLINSDWGQDTITDEQSQYATNFIQSIYMMYLRLCALQQTSKGDVTDCQYQCYSGGSTIKKETVDGYLPRTVIGTARRGVLVSKTTATTPANLPFPSSPSGISKIEKRLTTKQVVAALEAHEKMRETTLLDSSDILTTKDNNSKSTPTIRKVARRTVSSAMNTAFKDIFDQMTKYKLEARDQIPPLVTKSSILPSSSKVASASSPAKVTTRITETVATTVATATALSVNPTQSSEKVLNQLLDIMKDPNRLKLLEQLLAAINDEIKIDQIINNLPSDRLSQLENALISPLPNKQTDCDDVKDKNENDNDINNNNKYNDLYQQLFI